MRRLDGGTDCAGRGGDAPRRGWRHPQPCAMRRWMFPTRAPVELRPEARAKLTTSWRGPCGRGLVTCTRAAPGPRPSGITTGLRGARCTGTGRRIRVPGSAARSCGGYHPPEMPPCGAPQGVASFARTPPCFASADNSVAPCGAPLPSSCRGERGMQARPRLSKNRADFARLDLRRHCEERSDEAICAQIPTAFHNTGVAIARGA